MAFHLSIFLILLGLTGVYGIITVTKVSVKVGDSISIPCLYDQKYINHVKYLCNGNIYSSCSYAVMTNQPNSKKFSISDDKGLKIFTVTIKDVTVEDKYFWCLVEINRGTDVGIKFQLSVTGASSLYVDHQEVTGFIGEPATIKCYCQNSEEAKWCRVGGSCVQEWQGSINGTTVALDRNMSNVLRVTMRGLKMTDSGWYWCEKGDLQMPVHLSVREKSTTASKGWTTRGRKPGYAETDASETTGEDAARSDSEPSHIYTTANFKFNNSRSSSWNILSGSFMALIISLSLLILIVILSLFIWFWIKRQKPIQEESSAEVLAEDEETYSKVMKNQTSSGQPFCIETEVTYSCLELPQQGRRPGTLCSENEVSYSSVKIPQREKAREATDIYCNLTYSHKY